MLSWTQYLLSRATWTTFLWILSPHASLWFLRSSCDKPRIMKIPLQVVTYLTRQMQWRSVRELPHYEMYSLLTGTSLNLNYYEYSAEFCTRACHFKLALTAPHAITSPTQVTLWSHGDAVLHCLQRISWWMWTLSCTGLTVVANSALQCAARFYSDEPHPQSLTKAQSSIDSACETAPPSSSHFTLRHDHRQAAVSARRPTSSNANWLTTLVRDIGRN